MILAFRRLMDAFEPENTISSLTFDKDRTHILLDDFGGRNDETSCQLSYRRSRSIDDILRHQWCRASSRGRIYLLEQASE